MTADYWTPGVSYTDEFVALAHQGQPYGEEPYVNHVRRVAGRLRPHGEWAYMAGLLHDVVEDTVVTLKLLRDLGYPDMVVRAVDAVTLREGENYMDRIYIAAAHPLACHVKLADNTDNRFELRNLIKTEPRRVRRLCEKYDEALAVLVPARDAHMREHGLGRQECMLFGPAMAEED
jgi:(p)ppGpp synthase/HD superfamily hydrolase